MRSSEPPKGLAICRAKSVPSFHSYFKTQSIGLAPGIEPMTPTLQSGAPPTELILLGLYK